MTSPPDQGNTMQHLHDWDVSYAEARELQEQLSRKVSFQPLNKRPKLIAGLDCAFADGGKKLGNPG